MKIRTVIILSVLCAVLGGAAYWMLVGSGPPGDRPDDGGGRKLLTDLPVNDIAEVVITGPDGGVHLKKGDPVWQVASRYNYPASFSKLTDLVRKVKDMTIHRSFPVQEDILSRQALRPPEGDAAREQKATRITFKNAGGQILSDLLTGKPRESQTGFGGQYLMAAGGSVIHLVDKEFRAIETSGSKWLKEDLVDVGANAVQTVRCLDPDGKTVRFQVRRPEKGKDPEWIDLPQGKTPNPGKLSTLFGALSQLRVEDVADPALSAEAAGLSGAPRLEFQLYDGALYTVCIGDARSDPPRSRPVSFRVAYAAPPDAGGKPSPDKESSPGESAKPEDPEPDPSAAAKAAADKNTEIGPWTFFLPQWQANRLITDPEELLEKPPAPPAETVGKPVMKK